MAQKFACDPEEADVVARELTRMRSDIKLSVPHPLADAMSTMTGGPVVQALAEFLNAVTTAQTSLIASVDTAAGLFAGLVEGALDLDQVFAGQAMEM
ncbi:hypothetical protein OG568_14800 [Streptomyces sp. NBC_01450]|jgi:hypothetical protein|uniref:hypothetical protein n=1 Tax=Streptomyces sp. NBC_01450 TaxID=2903871 RepID=UPI002E304B81|nr:hypothetical protein [Streptomyces sp. NBC_01450]